MPLKPADKEHLIEVVNEMANRGLRTLAITYRDYKGDIVPEEAPDFNLTVLALVGIKVCCREIMWWLPAPADGPAVQGSLGVIHNGTPHHSTPHHIAAPHCLNGVVHLR